MRNYRRISRNNRTYVIVSRGIINTADIVLLTSVSHARGDDVRKTMFYEIAWSRFYAAGDPSSINVGETDQWYCCRLVIRTVVLRSWDRVQAGMAHWRGEPYQQAANLWSGRFLDVKFSNGGKTKNYSVIFIRILTAQRCCPAFSYTWSLHPN